MYTGTNNTLGTENTLTLREKSLSESSFSMEVFTVVVVNREIEKMVFFREHHRITSSNGCVEEEPSFNPAKIFCVEGMVE